MRFSAWCDTTGTKSRELASATLKSRWKFLLSTTAPPSVAIPITCDHRALALTPCLLCFPLTTLPELVMT